MERMNTTVIDAMTNRARGRYADEEVPRFCIETLGFHYPLAVYEGVAILRSGYVYKFVNRNTGAPVWVVSVRLPRQWEKFDAPVEIAGEPQQQLDDRFIFAISASTVTNFNLCSDGAVDQLLSTIYSTLLTSDGKSL